MFRRGPRRRFHTGDRPSSPPSRENGAGGPTATDPDPPAILRADAAHLDPWLRLRAALRPDAAAASHRDDADRMLRHPDRALALLAHVRGEAVALAEAWLRTDHVDGCDTSPVAFLEGLYVRPPHRRTGLARALCRAVEAWAAGHGCTELASDALLSNAAAHHAHRALGFTETERVVFFRRPLRRPDADPAP